MLQHKKITPNAPDKDVVKAILQGDREAFSILLQRYIKTVHAIGFAATGSHADAEDLTQDVFMKAYTSLDKLRDPNKFAAWLMIIARNASRTFVRKKNVRHARVPFHSGVETQSDPEDDVVFEALRQHVDALAEHERDVVVLHYFVGKTTREAAELLDITQDAVAKRLQRAREALGERMLARLRQPIEKDEDSSESAKKIMGAILLVNPPWFARISVHPSATNTSVAKTVGGAITVKKTVIVTILAIIALASAVLFQQTRPSTSAARIERASLDTKPSVNARPKENIIKTENKPTTKTKAAEQAKSNAASGNMVDPVGSIVGRVIDERGNAAPNVIVTAKAMLQASLDSYPSLNPDQLAKEGTTTGDDGEFAFENLAYGMYRLYAESGNHIALKSVTLDENSKLQAADITLRLEPTFEINGRVEDENGDAIEGAVVIPQPSNRRFEDLTSAVLESGFSVTTSKDGAFVLPDLKDLFLSSQTWDGSPGISNTVTLVTLAKGYELTWTSVKSDPEGVPANLTIVLRPGLLVTGTVLDERGNPVEGVYLGVFREAVEPFRLSSTTSTRTRDDGTFTISELPFEPIFLAAVSHKFATTYVKIIPVPGGVHGVVIRLIESPTIQAAILRDGFPVPDGQCILNEPMSDVHQYRWVDLNGQCEFITHAEGQVELSASIKEDGRTRRMRRSLEVLNRNAYAIEFNFQDVAAPPGQLEVHFRGGTNIKEVRASVTTDVSESEQEYLSFLQTGDFIQEGLTPGDASIDLGIEFTNDEYEKFERDFQIKSGETTRITVDVSE
jgi:RNA polymerase sigma-70 factor (ECF subfamily)